MKTKGLTNKKNSMDFKFGPISNLRQDIRKFGSECHENIDF